jgi:glucose/arabinose dehydrogenase
MSPSPRPWLRTTALAAWCLAPLLLAVLPAAHAECPVLEQRAANAGRQQPAFAGQTRACGVRTQTTLELVVVARGLEHPWAVEPLPDGQYLVTEKPGRLRLVTADGRVLPPIAGVPTVDARGQGGLLDVALSPGFAADRTLFFSYTEPREGGNGTSVARAVLAPAGDALEQVRVILRSQPSHDGTKHYGSRLAFGPDGLLYVTLGERADRGMRAHAQRRDSHLGKILRITADGGVPPDNPQVGVTGAAPEVWSLGHRNVQAAAFDPAGRLWAVEHGTRGGDELNLIARGANYGWPVAAYGEEYIGLPIGGADTARTGTQQPVYYWDPVIGPSGAQFYTGSAVPEWQGNLIVGSLRDMLLVRLVIEQARVVGEEHLFAARRQRVRDVRQGPDGALYVVTDARKGELWRITARR